MKYLNKEVDIPAVHSLLLIPFFDGFYIYSPDMSFNDKITQHVEEFNKIFKDEGCVFVEKQHENVVKYITDTEEFRKITVILAWLRDDESTRIFTPFLYILKNKKPALFETPDFSYAEIEDTDVNDSNGFIKNHLHRVREQTAYVFDVMLNLGDFHTENEIAHLVLLYIGKENRENPDL